MFDLTPEKSVFAVTATHRPCLILAIILSLGIMAGKYVPVPLWGWLIVCVAGIIIFCVARTFFVNRIIEKKWLWLLKVFLGIACSAVLISVGYVAYQFQGQSYYCRDSLR